MENEKKNVKELKISEVMNSLTAAAELSYKVLCEMQNKQDAYFGGTPEKVGTGQHLPRPEVYGIFDKMSESLNSIKRNLIGISEIINLF